MKSCDCAWGGGYFAALGCRFPTVKTLEGWTGAGWLC
jgi:hypothetical protein